MAKKKYVHVVNHLGEKHRYKKAVNYYIDEDNGNLLLVNKRDEKIGTVSRGYWAEVIISNSK